MNAVESLRKDMAEEGEGEEHETDEVDAARDILSAIAHKDASALSMALHRHYELCAAGEEEGPKSSDNERY